MHNARTPHAEFAEFKSVISNECHHGAMRLFGIFERRQQSPDLIIDEADACTVRASTVSRKAEDRLRIVPKETTFSFIVMAVLFGR